MPLYANAGRLQAQYQPNIGPKIITKGIRRKNSPNHPPQSTHPTPTDARNGFSRPQLFWLQKSKSATINVGPACVPHCCGQESSLVRVKVVRMLIRDHDKTTVFVTPAAQKDRAA